MPEKDSDYLVMRLLIVFMILFSVIFPISAEKSQKHSSYQVIIYHNKCKSYTQKLA